MEGVFTHRRAQGVQPRRLRGETGAALAESREAWNSLASLGFFSFLAQKHVAMPSTSSKQIDLDINRTFREHKLYKERYGE
jgi:hypothetical protein